MIKELSGFLSEIFKINFEIIDKSDFNPRDKKKFFPLNKNYIAVYEGKISSKDLFKIKSFLDKILTEYENIKENLVEYEILKRGLQSVLNTNELYFKGSKKLESFFSFLEENNIDYAILENNEIVVNKNIDKFTLETTIRKLKKVDKINIPVKEGELFALRVGFYTLIAKSNKKIEKFIKDVIQIRLLWLNALYEAKNLYEIDELTGLYSRRKFLEDLKNFDKKIFIFINIKDFKTINEIYTSSIGDQILKEFALRIKKYFKECRAYRIYGDRFVIVTDKPLKSCLQTFQKKINKPFLIFNFQTKEYINVSLNFRLAIFKEYTKNILEKSNLSFRKCSKDIIFFEKDVKPLLEKEEKYLSFLIEALEKNQIILFFQRVIDLKSNSTAYFEVLLRVKKDGKIYPSDEFIEVAKERGLYYKLNSMVIKKAVYLQKILNKPISLNVSTYDIFQKDFIVFLREIIEENSVNPKMIQFELLETEDIYENMDKVREFINGVKKIGCKVALDDFGKGYSNFIVLSDIKIDSLKIDRSLIKKINKDRRFFNIVKAIVEMASNLGLNTTAEGIENKNILEKVKNIGIDYAQGFFIEKPKSFEEILKNINNYKI